MLASKQFNVVISSPCHVSVECWEVDVDHLLEVVVNSPLPIDSVRADPKLHSPCKYL